MRDGAILTMMASDIKTIDYQKGNVTDAVAARE